MHYLKEITVSFCTRGPWKICFILFGMWALLKNWRQRLEDQVCSVLCDEVCWLGSKSYTAALIFFVGCMAERLYHHLKS